ncbi:MAG: hypothetical protein II863_08760 [Kiritimatiellae bacterium]|nr:hypothetical protein [Kiritimatiellia bacterium]
MKKSTIMAAASVCAFATFADVHEGVQLWEGGPYWATTNIGAEEPWDYGYYFWWGDTVGYKLEGDAWVASDGSSDSFSFKDVPTYRKTIADLRNNGWINADYCLTPEHDAAQAHWGEGWRLPTYNEISDLDSRCTWIWTTTNGVKGYIVRGKGDYISKSIFLPAAGHVRETSLTWAGTSGSYWSSYPVTGTTGCARGISISSGEHTAGSANNGRSCGFSVRPVRGFAASAPSILEDPGATVTGDAESGYTVKPSVESGAIEVSIPTGVDAAKVTIVVAASVESVKANGASVRVIGNGGHDITNLLDIPAADANGVVDMTKATVKQSVAEEVIDTAKGAKVSLDPAAPSIETSNTYPGLKYTFVEGRTIGAMSPTEQYKWGDGAPFVPVPSIKGGESAFYSIRVEK